MYVLSIIKNALEFVCVCVCTLVCIWDLNSTWMCKNFYNCLCCQVKTIWKIRLSQPWVKHRILIILSIIICFFSPHVLNIHLLPFLSFIKHLIYLCIFQWHLYAFDWFLKWSVFAFRTKMWELLWLCPE